MEDLVPFTHSPSGSFRLLAGILTLQLVKWWFPFLYLGVEKAHVSNRPANWRSFKEPWSWPVQ